MDYDWPVITARVCARLSPNANVNELTVQLGVSPTENKQDRER